MANMTLPRMTIGLSGQLVPSLTLALKAQGFEGGALPALSRGVHSLTRSRSLEQAPMPDGGPARSKDAPVDPFDKRHRDTEGMTEADVEAEAKRTVEQAGARATEALSGSTEKLHNDPAWTMTQEYRSHTAFGDWANSVVGDGVKETVKHGAQAAKDALKKMFDPAGGSGASSVVGRENPSSHDGTSPPSGQVPGSVRRNSGGAQ